MPRVHMVKKARKDNPAVKKGEPYYYWTFGKRYSATYPRPSQLTQSEFLSQIYSFAEECEDFKVDDSDPVAAMEELQSFAESMADQIEELGEEQQSKKDDLPENFQEGPTGQLFESRYDACEEMASTLRDIDFDIDEDLSDEEKQARLEEALGEVQNVSYDGE